MQKAKLPENLKGEWIWCGMDPSKNESYVFFRKEFAFAGVVSDANLWISANSSYHILINGRLLGYGPPPSTGEITYAELYDLSYYLETGANTIGVIVHSDSKPEISRTNKLPGLWCQLDIEGEPFLW